MTIHTLTMNPSVDVTIALDTLQPGEAQRVGTPVEYAGGKGINVSKAAARLGTPTVAWTFLGGDNGRRWERLAEDFEFPIETTEIPGETRTNYKIFEKGRSRQTDLNTPGPEFDGEASSGLLAALGSSVKSGDYLVVSGSASPRTPKDWWGNLAGIAAKEEVKLVVDTTGPTLDAFAQKIPWMIKINLDELNGWRGSARKTLADLSDDPPKLDFHLIVTDGAEGALAIPSGEEPILVPAMKTEVRGTVGAGDAFLAGWLKGWIDAPGDWPNALAWAAATAAGAVELEGTEFPTLERVRERVETGL